MPQNMTLEEIARTNPHVDLEKLEESRKLRQTLVDRGLFGKRTRGLSGFQDERAKIVDDAHSDARLVRLAH
jgi:hypothetical protein